MWIISGLYCLGQSVFRKNAVEFTKCVRIYLRCAYGDELVLFDLGRPVYARRNACK